MPKFSQASLSRLEQAHPSLQMLFNEVIKHYDCTVTCGYRGQAEQDAAYAAGNSKLKYPNGKHNCIPSNAVDVYPFPVKGNTNANYYHFGGFVCAVAEMLHIPITWGGDWDNDKKFNDQNFNDLVHFEIKG